jgi:anti-sigma factor RsiW
MLSCADFPNLLFEYTSNELPPRTRREVADHLACCPRCRVAFGRYRRVVALARTLPAREPPSRLLERFRAALTRSKAGGPYLDFCPF